MPTSLTGVRAVRGVNVLPINKQNKTNISMRKNKTKTKKQKKRSIDNIVQAIRYGMGSRHVFTSFPNMNLLLNLCFDFFKC